MNKGTLIFFAVVVALSGLTYALYQRGEQQKHAEKQAAMLFGNLDTNSVRSVRLQSAQKEIQLQKHRTNSRWYVMSPVKDRADDRSVEDFLTELKEQSIRLVAQDPDQVQTAQNNKENFGLNRPYWSVHIVDAKGRSWRAQVSAKRAFDGSLYLQKNDPNQKPSKTKTSPNNTPADNKSAAATQLDRPGAASPGAASPGAASPGAASPGAASPSSSGAVADSSVDSLYLPQVYTAGEGVVDILEKKTNNFQSKMMFEKDSAITEAQFLRVNLKHKSRSNLELHLEKNQVKPKADNKADEGAGGDKTPMPTLSVWQLRGRHHEPLEQQRVEDFLESIKLFHADEVIENQKTGDLYEKYHLYKPDFKIQVEHEKGLWELRISEGKDKFVYMTSSSSLGIYKLSLSAAEVLYRKENSFLDFTKPFVFDVAQVQKIKLHTKNEQQVFVMDDKKKWHQTSQRLAPGKTVAKSRVQEMENEALEAPEVRHDYVDKLVENLRYLKAEQFYSPKKNLKFTDQDQSIEFSSRDDTLVFEMKWRQLGSNYAAATSVFDGFIEIEKSQLDKSLELQLTK